MKHKTLIYLAMFCLISAGMPAEASNNKVNPSDKTKKHKVSFGVKGGFNSAMTFTDQLSYGNQELSGIQNNYKVGYLATVFARITLKNKHFFQPEISYDISQGSISINNLRENATLLESSALIKTKMVSLGVPLLYGYKFIDAYPYGMSLFFGPKISWTLEDMTSSEFSGFYQKNITEEFHPFNYSIVAGIGVNISNIFFDFRYEAGLNNITKSVFYDKQQTESPYNEHEITLKRRKNILSFSVGVIF